MHSLMDAFEAGDDSGQVALEMNAEGEEVGDDDNAREAARGERGYGVSERRRRAIEEGNFDFVVTSITREFLGYRLHRFIGGGHGRPMSKENNPGLQTLPAM